MRARLWFRANIGGEEWSVYVGGPLGNLEGLCDSHKARIYLSPKLVRSRVYGVLAHELAHAANFMAGVDKALACALGADDEDMGEVEEVFVSTSHQAVYVMQSTNGWLRYPELPEWYQ